MAPPETSMVSCAMTALKLSDEELDILIEALRHYLDIWPVSEEAKVMQPLLERLEDADGGKE
jgi:hypothetical protein